MDSEMEDGRWRDRRRLRGFDQIQLICICSPARTRVNARSCKDADDDDDHGGDGSMNCDLGQTVVFNVHNIPDRIGLPAYT